MNLNIDFLNVLTLAIHEAQKEHERIEPPGNLKAKYKTH